jgi:hypothetical protein
LQVDRWFHILNFIEVFMGTKKMSVYCQESTRSFANAWLSVVALFGLVVLAQPARAMEPTALAGLKTVTQQLNEASAQLTSAGLHNDKAKASAATVTTVQYSVEGALAVLTSVNLDLTGRYAIELWATRTYYTSTPNNFSGIPMGKKIIGNYVGGSFLPSMWTIIPFTTAVPSGYYPTIVITRDDGSNNWPFSYAVSSSTTLLDPAAVTSGVFEFYAPSLNHYFITANTAEAANLANNPQLGWRLTGDIQIHIARSLAGVEGTYGVCRFYGHPTIGPNSHFYTADPNECNFLRQLQLSTPFGRPRWNYEEISFAAFLPNGLGQCPSPSTPVARFYNNGAAANDSNHRYVSTQANFNAMLNAGWRNEGAVMCVGFATPGFDPALYR